MLRARPAHGRRIGGDAARLDAVLALGKRLARDLASLAGENTIFGGSAADKLERLRAEIGPLSCRYDVVVANPPYMGSKNTNKWLAGWVKNVYPNSKRDLCTCFIEHGFDMLSRFGYSAMVTMESWMFLSSFEQLRKNILKHHSIATMVYMNHMVMRIAFNTCATVFCNQYTTAPGLYTKVEYEDLNDEGIPFEFPVKRHAPKQNAGVLEALADPDCDWFYRQTCVSFRSIPGSPIAYWIKKTALEAFSKNKAMKQYARTSKGLITGDNDEFFRLWWEISHQKIGFEIDSNEESLKSGLEWFPLNKGGKFRKWYGNNEYVIHWAKDGQTVHEHAKNTGHHSQDYDSSLKFKENISWSDISSGLVNFRYRHNELSDHKGMPLFPLRIPLNYCLGLLNSSVCAYFLSFLSPTLSCNIGEIEKLPISIPKRVLTEGIEQIVLDQIENARTDWNSFEESWGFIKHPLI